MWYATLRNFTVIQALCTVGKSTLLTASGFRNSWLFFWQKDGRLFSSIAGVLHREDIFFPLLKNKTARVRRSTPTKSIAQLLDSSHMLIPTYCIRQGMLFVNQHSMWTQALVTALPASLHYYLLRAKNFFSWQLSHKCWLHDFLLLPLVTDTEYETKLNFSLIQSNNSYKSRFKNMPDDSLPDMNGDLRTHLQKWSLCDSVC